MSVLFGYVSLYFLGNQKVSKWIMGLGCAVGTGGRGCIDDILGSGRRWKADSEIGESRNSRWKLLLGKSCVWSREVVSGAKIGEDSRENILFRHINCMKCLKPELCNLSFFLFQMKLCEFISWFLGFFWLTHREHQKLALLEKFQSILQVMPSPINLLLCLFPLRIRNAALFCM